MLPRVAWVLYEYIWCMLASVTVFSAVREQHARPSQSFYMELKSTGETCTVRASLMLMACSALVYWLMRLAPLQTIGGLYTLIAAWQFILLYQIGSFQWFLHHPRMGRAIRMLLIVFAGLGWTVWRSWIAFDAAFIVAVYLLVLMVGPFKMRALYWLLFAWYIIVAALEVLDPYRLERVVFLFRHLPVRFIVPLGWTLGVSQGSRLSGDVLLVGAVAFLSAYAEDKRVTPFVIGGYAIGLFGAVMVREVVPQLPAVIVVIPFLLAALLIGRGVAFWKGRRMTALRVRSKVIEGEVIDQ